MGCGEQAAFQHGRRRVQIATNCIQDGSRYPVFEKIRYISSDTRESWFRGHPEPKDIVFVCKGAPGRVALVPDPVGFAIAQDMEALRANPGVIDYRYLYYLLKSKITQEKINNLHVGTMIPCRATPSLTTRGQVGVIGGEHGYCR